MLDSLQFSIPLIVFSFAALGVFGVVLWPLVNVEKNKAIDLESFNFSKIVH